ncbi:DUF2782 domain-containing protein [Noviherbaspirillum sp.]|uniref:DUF2782 domain-containing protein n=1 Tax=Noviherbaspirillum sp. TaxID=1926288 RepID=UPI002D351BA4|nr:DUF2782 domain-containing protein [Noviherbaspirillum sp.]HZW22991.1 DUF2782 domain-containing protein [Noviherbaspirillum sp.]
MRTTQAWRFAIATIATIAFQAITQAASAQQPPQLEKLEEGEAPAVTIRKPDQKSRIEEKRAPGGKVTEVKVTSGGGTYVVKPNDQAGSAQPGDLQSNTIRPAQWLVKEFDLSRQEKEQQEEAANVPPPAPPAKK